MFEYRCGHCGASVSARAGFCPNCRLPFVGTKVRSNQENIVDILEGVVRQHKVVVAIGATSALAVGIGLWRGGGNVAEIIFLPVVTGVMVAWFGNIAIEVFDIVRGLVELVSKRLKTRRSKRAESMHS